MMRRSGAKAIKKSDRNNAKIKRVRAAKRARAAKAWKKNFWKEEA